MGALGAPEGGNRSSALQTGAFMACRQFIGAKFRRFWCKTQKFAHLCRHSGLDSQAALWHKQSLYHFAGGKFFV